MEIYEAYVCFLVIDRLNSSSNLPIAVNSVLATFHRVDFAQLDYSFLELTGDSQPVLPASSTNIVVPLSNIPGEEIFYQRIENDLWSGHVSVCRQARNGFGNRFEKMVRIGHRGCGMNKYSPDFAENTIASFLEARRRGAHATELDVHLTRDGHLIVHHDGEINGREIWSSDYRDLSPASGASLGHLLLLGEVLESLPDDFGINIELKCPKGYLLDFGEYQGRIAAAVMILLQQYPEKKILFSSFSLAACIYLRMLNSACSVCFLVHSELFLQGPPPEINNALVRLARDAGLDGFVLGSEILDENEALVSCAREASMGLYCYGKRTNSLYEALRLMRLDFTGLITDNLHEISSIGSSN